MTATDVYFGRPEDLAKNEQPEGREETACGGCFTRVVLDYDKKKANIRQFRVQLHDGGDGLYEWTCPLCKFQDSVWPIEYKRLMETDEEEEYLL